MLVQQPAVSGYCIRITGKGKMGFPVEVMDSRLSLMQTPTGCLVHRWQAQRDATSLLVK